ncbi:hypothetical protein QNH36_03435 [Mesobacillus sp. AQ2]|uniref:hypothetical protein n=1 Tax=Bacillaceae TaxID=186817 RepID=UPI0011AA6EF5|nr:MULTISPECIES: hypothetical protein [Bacillaceae]WHX41228.1 hypothetical protein QNH36_03435 [Mesobacillus sp. AQ2]
MTVQLVAYVNGQHVHPNGFPSDGVKAAVKKQTIPQETEWSVLFDFKPVFCEISCEKLVAISNRKSSFRENKVVCSIEIESGTM